MSNLQFLIDTLTAPTLVSSASDGSIGNHASGGASVSADGRYVLFQSLATNLVSGDTNGYQDIFEKDLITGATTRISTNAAGGQANGTSEHAHFANGQVVFDSNATDLVAATNTYGRFEVFVKNPASGAVMLASQSPAGFAANGDSTNGVLSADGHSVAYQSLATNLAGADTNHASDIYVTDLTNGQVVRASTDANGAEANGQSADVAWSPDGHSVAFESNASNLVAGDTNGAYDIFVKNLVTGAIARVSTAADGTQANGHSFHPVFTPDGGSIMFESAATNLVAGGTTGGRDIFEKNLTTGAITLVSTGGEGQANAPSFNAAAGGQFAAFESLGTNLPGGATGGHRAVYLGTNTGAVLRVNGVGGAALNADALHPALSADGQTLVFETGASNAVAGGASSSTVYVEHIVKTVAIGSVTENAGPATGRLLFTDADPNAVHSVSVSAAPGALGTFTATLATDTAHGAATTGAVDWHFGSDGFAALAAGETMTETFTITLADNAGHSIATPVTLTLTGVNDAPVAHADAVTLSAGAATGDLRQTLLANDTDVDHGDKLSVAGVDTAGTLGTVSIDPTSGAVTYSANAAQFASLGVGQSATDHFAYTVHDLAGATSTAQVSVTVNGVHHLPVANADTLNVNAGTTSADLTQTLLANDTDTNPGDHLSIVSIDTTGTQGMLTRDPATGALTYSANAAALAALGPGQSATDHFTYTVHDLAGDTSTAQVTVTVNGVNHAPTANADAVTVNSGAVTGDLTQTLLANDIDPDKGDHLSIAGVDTTGTQGTVAIDPVTGALTYDANAAQYAALQIGQTATDHFSYTVHDAAGATSQAQVTVTIEGQAPDGQTLTAAPGGSTLQGGAGHDTLIGGAGNDILIGGAQGDVMIGGGGNDTFIVNNTADQVIEQANGGRDTVQTTLSSYVLPANVERLIYTGTADFTGTGNNLGNVIQGGRGNDMLTGGAGNDWIQGGAGNDVIDGGAGADTLWGGSGANIFIERRGQAQGDMICDFNTHGSSDKIELVGWGAGTTFTTNGSGQFTIHDGVDGHSEVMTVIGPVHPADIVFG